MNGNPTPADPGPASPPLHPRWLVTSGNFFFRFRNALFPVVFAVVLLLFRPAQFLHSPSLDRIAMSIGVAIALLGQAFRLTVIGYAYIKRGGRDGRVYATDLVIAGLYAHSRNPMYAGNFLIACGVGVVFGSPWMYFLVIPFFAYVYLSITATEEQYLLGRFGASFEAYMRQVNRFIPDFRGLRQSLQGYRFQWRRALSKDHGTVFATLTGLLVIMMWKLYWIYGWDAKGAEIVRLGWLFIPLLVFYVVIRILKRFGRLNEPQAFGG